MIFINYFQPKLVNIISFLLTSWIFILNGCNDFKTQREYEIFSPPNDLAYNDGKFRFPSPVESDKGWGGGSWCWHIVDGLRSKTSGWMSGLAFTGGSEQFIDTCGWRQMTIDFGKEISFNRIIVFHVDPVNIPLDYWVLYWDSKTEIWDTAAAFHLDKVYIRSLSVKFKEQEPFIEDTFKTVKSRKIRYIFNNCKTDHGWINEFEVYYDKPSERPDCLLFKN